MGVTATKYYFCDICIKDHTTIEDYEECYKDCMAIKRGITKIKFKRKYTYLQYKRLRKKIFIFMSNKEYNLTEDLKILLHEFFQICPDCYMYQCKEHIDA